MHVLAISYGKNIFDVTNTDSVRQQHLATHVLEYHMVVFSREGDGLMHTQIGNLFLHPTNSSSKIGMVIDAVRIGKRILRAEQATWVVTAQDPFEAGFVGFLLKKFSGVSLSFNIQEHGNFFGQPHWRGEQFLNIVRTFLGSFLLRRADTVRAVSERIKKSLLALGVRSERVTVLPVCTDTAAFGGASGGAGLRAELGDDAIIVVTVARFVAQKNLSLLLRAFQHVAGDDARYRLVVVGRGEEKEALLALREALGLAEQVLFIDWSDDVPSIFAEADVYALSSNYEGWGRVLVEAMAAGLPVVTTDVGCAGEVVEDGAHGYVVPVGDEETFAAALGKVLGSVELRKRISSKNKDDIQKLIPPVSAYGTAWVLSLQ